MIDENKLYKFLCNNWEWLKRLWLYDGENQELLHYLTKLSNGEIDENFNIAENKMNIWRMSNDKRTGR